MSLRIYPTHPNPTHVKSQCQLAAHRPTHLNKPTANNDNGAEKRVRGKCTVSYKKAMSSVVPASSAFGIFVMVKHSHACSFVGCIRLLLATRFVHAG